MWKPAKAAANPGPGRHLLARAAVLLVLAAAAPALFAQPAVDVSRLIQNYESVYKFEQVTLHGWVDREKPVTSRSYKGYYLKDRYGRRLLVRTTAPLPGITTEIQVTGVAEKDADTGEIYLSETTRNPVSSPASPSASPTTQPDPKLEQMRAAVSSAQQAIAATDWTSATAAITRLKTLDPAAPQVAELERALADGKDHERSQQVVLWVIGIGVLALAGAAIVLYRRKQKGADGEPGSAIFPWEETTKTADGSQPAQDGVDEYRTVRVYKTSKVLPATFVVMENGQETDSVFLSDQSGKGEIEIGRDSPDVHGGIRIKDATNTLSRRQARIVYTAETREFLLTNLAGTESNPTIVNGQELQENQSVVLQSGDMVTMGSVQLRFNKK